MTLPAAGPAVDSSPGAGPHRVSGVELAVVLVLLAIGSVTGCILAAAWLTLWLGPVPFPITVLVAGAWSLLLVRVAAMWSDRTAVVAFPALVFILTLIALDLGPGGDMPVPISLRGIALLVFGGLIPLWVAAYGRSLTPDTHRR